MLKAFKCGMGIVLAVAAFALGGCQGGGFGDSGGSSFASPSGTGDVLDLDGHSWTTSQLAFTGGRQKLGEDGEAGSFLVKPSTGNGIGRAIAKIGASSLGAYGAALTSKSLGGGTVSQVALGAGGAATGDVAAGALLGDGSQKLVWADLNQPPLQKFRSPKPLATTK